MTRDGTDQQTGGTKDRVLLVEDSEGNILVGRTYLELFGFDVDIARDGKAAVDCAGKTNYAAILMDIEMPEMDGVSATTAIRREEVARNHRRTPIVVLTSHLTNAIRHLCVRAGADLVLSKPMTSQMQGTLAQLMAA